VSVLAARCSAARGEILVPRTHLATVQQRAFSVVGPSARNDLPVELDFLLDGPPFKILHLPFKSPSSLAVTGLGVPLSNSVLKRRYISLRNE